MALKTSQMGQSCLVALFQLLKIVCVQAHRLTMKMSATFRGVYGLYHRLSALFELNIVYFCDLVVAV